MATTEDDLQPITDDDLLLKPYFELPPEIDEIPQTEEASGPDGLSQFDARHRDPFTGLLFIGHLSKVEKIFGHTFELQTPAQSERLEAGLLHKPYVNTISSEIAWAALQVAIYLRSVDGSELPQPIGPRDTGVADRFNWVLDNLKGVVIEQVFTRCLLLDSKVDEIIEELNRVGEASG